MKYNQKIEAKKHTWDTQNHHNHHNHLSTKLQQSPANAPAPAAQPQSARGARDPTALSCSTAEKLWKSHPKSIPKGTSATEKPPKRIQK